MYENNIKNICDAQKGDKQALEDLIKDNSGLIYSIVKRFRDRGYELDDLYQIAVIGFIKSIKRFDTSFDVKLSTYAVPYILGEVKRFIRDDGLVKVSRSMKELGIKIKDLQKLEMQKNGRDLRVEEIAKKLGVSAGEVASAIDAFLPVESISQTNYTNEEGSLNIEDTLSTKVDEANVIANRLSVRSLIDELEGKEKDLIILRYYQGKTQMQVAEILGITQVQVSRIEKRILNSMRLKLVT